MELNMPWVHSPFFEEELSKRGFSDEMQQYARHYHKEGYVQIENVIDTAFIDTLVAEVETKFGQEYSLENPKKLDIWKEVKSVKALAANQKILEVLQQLYDRVPIPFQTLSLKYGSQQEAHSDSIHFNALPNNFMCGVWVALEDVNEENGALMYYPGSQNLPEFDYSIFHQRFKPKEHFDHREDYTQFYEPFVKQLMQDRGLKPTYLNAKKGDVLIWSANFVHGGMPVKNKRLTRWSQVTHYFFENCLYTVPMLSNTVSGEWFLKEITNIKTGKTSWGDYNGDKVVKKNIGDQRYLISPSAGFNKRDFDQMVGKVFKVFGKNK